MLIEEKESLIEDHYSCVINFNNMNMVIKKFKEFYTKIILNNPLNIGLMIISNQDNKKFQLVFISKHKNLKNFIISNLN